MKKILLTIMLYIITVAATMSQNMMLTNASETIANGSTITIYGNLASDNKIDAIFMLKNLTSSNLNIKVKKVENFIVGGSLNNFCFAGSCFNSTTYSAISLISADKGNYVFEGQYMPKGNEGTSSITYTFYDLNNPADSIWVYVHYIVSTTSINDIFSNNLHISEPYPNPAKYNSFINYKTTYTKNEVKYLITDILGNTFSEGEINNQEGTLILDLSSFSNGIYFFSLITNNITIASKKIIVQH